MIDMEKVRYIVTAALDSGWHDGEEVWLSAREGGVGSTSCSVNLVISNADSWEQEYIITIHEVEDDTDGDY